MDPYDMINGWAEVDSKHNVILRSSGNLIFMSYDDLAKELLMQKEKAGVLNMDMDGGPNDKTRTSLIEAIIDSVAKDTPNEAVTREFNILSDTKLFQKGGTETVHEFMNRYKSAVEKDVNETV